MDKLSVSQLKQHAKNIRCNIIKAVYHAQTGHEGPALSLVEILTALYFNQLRFNRQKPKDPKNDRFVLSKGHSCPVLYALFVELGLIPQEELLTLRQLGSRLQGHPNAETMPWVDVSTGSLGQGLSIAIGLAMGLGPEVRIYCVLGDGELQEGQNWEAAMSAVKFSTSNLITIIDRNGYQGDGHTEEIMPLGDLKAKWTAFGWHVLFIDGHDFVQIDQALEQAKLSKSKPTVIIANTIKGKGISYMENSIKWHHHPMNQEDYTIAMKELEEGSIVST